jgi:hypothetical protein
MMIKKILGFLIGLGLAGNAFAVNRHWETQELWLDQIATPANPVASQNKLYSKSGDVIAFLNSAGTESVIATNPMTTLGDLIYGGASGVPTRLVGDTSNTRKFLRELSVAGAATAEVWDTLVSSDIPNNGANTTGNATTATTATNAANVATTGVSTNAAYYPLFVSSSTNGNQACDLDSSFSFNPSTHALTATTFIGALTGAASLNLLKTNNLSDVASQQTSLDNVAGAVTANDIIGCNGTHCSVRALATADMPVVSVTPGAYTLMGCTIDATGRATACSSGASGAVASSSQDLENTALKYSVAANALTIALKQGDASTDCASGSGACLISFRNATSATSSYTQISTTGALSIVVPSSATLGQVSGNPEYTYVYAQNNAGTVQLCVTTNGFFDEGTVYTGTAITSGSTARATLYCTSAITGAVRLIGRMKSIQATAGTWASGVTEGSPVPLNNERVISLGPTRYRHEFYSIANNGTSCSVAGGSDTGASVTRTSMGLCTVTFTTPFGASANDMVCTCTNGNNGNINVHDAELQVETTTQVACLTYLGSSRAATDDPVQITCDGHL